VSDRKASPTDRPADSTTSEVSQTRSFVSGGGRRRRLVWLLVTLQILIPLTMLIARWQDPSIGVQPFGWQVHTNCWGTDQC
jgi:hypothetical protein